MQRILKMIGLSDFAWGTETKQKQCPSLNYSLETTERRQEIIPNHNTFSVRTSDRFHFSGLLKILCERFFLFLL